MKLLHDSTVVKLYHGDALEVIDTIPEGVIQSVITSPTYWGKRSFTENDREFGGESLEEYVDRNVLLYSKILDKMKGDGSLFVIIQDSYMGSGISRAHHTHIENLQRPEFIRDGFNADKQGNTSGVTARHDVIKNKSLCGTPWRIAIRLVDMGYIWREIIIWEKLNPYPSNVKDRVRQSSEYILHFTKQGRYKFREKYFQVKGQSGKLRMDNQVWIASPEPKDGHTATFPASVVSRLLLATTDKGDTVFEPFLGSGTVYDLCVKHARNFIGCDINETFVKGVVKRIKSSIEFYSR